MKTTLFFLLLIYSVTISAQSTPQYQPYFSAIVVKDATASSNWYKSVFGLKVLNEMKDPGGAYYIIILESPDFLVELLQLKGSVTRSEILKGKPDNTQIEGHFKIGFHVDKMDDWLKHLKDLKINVPRVYTDSDTKKRNFLVEDPDGNLVQFFE